MMLRRNNDRPVARPQDIQYKQSELYLDYAVSERIATMVRHASRSIHVLGYKFVADCDEGRDIFLALHDLGRRCARENRAIKITVAIDCRAGPSAGWKGSAIRGVDWLVSLNALFPQLDIEVVKVKHWGRDTVHAKAVVADNLVMLKSGEGSMFNGRVKAQGEDGILFHSQAMANSIREMIESTKSAPGSVSVLPRKNFRTLDNPAMASLENKKDFSAPVTLETINRLKSTMDELGNFDSQIFNAFEAFSSLQEKHLHFIQDIQALRATDEGVRLLKKLCHRYYDNLASRHQWLTTMLQVEDELTPHAKLATKKVEEVWMRGDDLAIIKKLPLGRKNNASEVLGRLKVRAQQQSMRLLIDQLTPHYQQPGVDGALSLVQQYEDTLKQLKELTHQLVAAVDRPNVAKAELLLDYEILWDKLLVIFEQLKQEGQCENTLPVLFEDIDEEDAGDNYDFLSETDYSRMYGFLVSLEGSEYENSPLKIFESRYEALRYDLKEFNKRFSKNFKESTATVLAQPGSSVVGHDRQSLYKQQFLAEIQKLNSGDVVKIAVSNLNDIDMLHAIKAACEQGVQVQIAIGKYMNHSLENLPGGGGSNKWAVDYLEQSLGQQYKKNLRLRWLVFTDGEHDRSIGSAKKTKGTHRKYVSFHKKSGPGYRSCMMGSSPLDKQGQEFSQELDVVITDAAQVQKCDEQLFASEYYAGVDLNFCYAMDSLKKAGFRFSADYFYQQYLQTIDLSGKSPNQLQRNDWVKQAYAFICQRSNLDYSAASSVHFKQAKSHLEQLGASNFDVNFQVENTLRYKLAIALDQYKKHKRFSNKRYLSLLNEIKGCKTEAGIRQLVIKRIQQQSGGLHANSFAVFLAKQSFFENVTKGLPGENGSDIIYDIKEKIFEKKSTTIGCWGSLFSDSKPSYQQVSQEQTQAEISTPRSITRLV